MTEDTAEKKPGKGGAKAAPETREERLRAALRANLARRKAQARGRAADAAETESGRGGQENE